MSKRDPEPPSVGTTRGIIKILGGPVVVAASLGRKRGAVDNWIVYGFTRSAEGDLVALAVRAGRPDITIQVLRAASAVASADAAARGLRSRRSASTSVNPLEQ